MPTKIRLSDLLIGATEITPFGTNTPNLKLAKPTIGGDADDWGNGSKGFDPNNPAKTAIGLNDNADILEAAVLDKRVGGTIAGPVIVDALLSVNATVAVSDDGLLSKRTVYNDGSTALRVLVDNPLSPGTDKWVNMSFSDVFGDGAADFSINYNAVGGGSNIAIHGSSGLVRLFPEALIEGDGQVTGDLTVDGTLIANGPIQLSGDYIQFPNKEPSFLTGVGIDGIMAFDSSRGIILYRTQQVGQEDGDGTYTVLDTSNISGGTGITISNTAKDIAGTQAITFSVTDNYVKGIKVDAAVNADQLGGQVAANYLRSNVNDDYAGTLTLTGRFVVAAADDNTKGIRLLNTAGERVDMFYESGAADAYFSISYLNSGGNDIRLHHNGDVELRKNLNLISGDYSRAGVSLDAIYAPFLGGFDGTPTWRAPTRNLATNYTNNTGHLIMVSVACAVADNQNMRAVVGGIVVHMSNDNGRYTATFVVPNGATYRIENDDGAVGSGTAAGLTKLFWAELD